MSDSFLLSPQEVEALTGAVRARSQLAWLADRGGQREPEQGKIAFTTWDEPERVFGNGKPHRMPMVPRR